MKSINYISTLLFSALLLLISSYCCAQIADSIKYKNGFLHYHEYGSKNLPPILILTGGPGNSCNQLEGLAEKIDWNLEVFYLNKEEQENQFRLPLTQRLYHF